MTKNEHIAYWLQSAKHDLDTAESLFKSSKYDWCLFIGHLVLEKVLKAIFVDKNDNKNPPKIHNLVKLAELSFLELTEDQKVFLDEVNDFNIESRYPDYKFEFHKSCTKKYTDQYFKRIKEFYKWLKSQLK
ncbi:MAG: HEPN domain-containing protein [candidate division Zixibacteria bacterium]|nr:HEPN domain-containing protein [Candidatus Tariuqbacter arcticus]